MNELANNQWQEWVALSIVGIVVLNIIRKTMITLFSAQLARLFLRLGKVKWAMAIQHKEKRVH